jgi:hypothetical protein
MSSVNAVTGREVYHWPEFKALCERLGVARGLPTTSITITLPGDDVVVVTHDYLGKERHLPQPEAALPHRDRDESEATDAVSKE